MKTLIYLTLMLIAKEKGIDEEDALDVLINASDKGLNPVDEFKKAFY